MAALYLIEILHQTTTSSRARARLLCCILSKFYIKPQLRRWRECHYVVVSYRNSTSNHNLFGTNCLYNELYLIEILHQTTTSNQNLDNSSSCILSKFYIKPQHWRDSSCARYVVSYRNSTSNHNLGEGIQLKLAVVSYRNSTSNHNLFGTNCLYNELYLIEILHQTTTRLNRSTHKDTLYLIEILHQTTTWKTEKT